MTRSLFVPLMFAALFGALFVTTSAIVAGQAVYQPAPITLELTSHGDCTLPCWNNIIPGETYLSSALILLREAGYGINNSSVGMGDYQRIDRPGCRVRLISTQEERIDGEIDGRIVEIRLLGCKGAILGDTMLVLRHPQVTSAGGARMSFLNGVAHVYTRGRACLEPRLTPFLRVDAVIITPYSDPYEGVLDWNGFGSYAAYRGFCLDSRVLW